jgi:uroporphyrinogen-III decarboxylase
MAEISSHSKGQYAVQAWSAFGMDAAVWFCGAEGAVFMAMDHPDRFGDLMDSIAETDFARTELACLSPEIDIVVQRGWYSSTDFWSPALFDRYVFPHLHACAALAHKHGKKYGYVMTTGVETLGERLVEAGVDLLYFADPVQDGLSLDRAAELARGGMTVAGGTNSVSLASGNRAQIEGEIRRALEILSPTNRFILHPVDAVFPDTPWESIEIMIECWQRFR